VKTNVPAWLRRVVQYIHRVSKKSSTSYFAKGLTDCKNFNGYRVRDNKQTQVCNQCFNFLTCQSAATWRINVY